MMDNDAKKDNAIEKVEESQSPGFPFMRLPRELRDQIYHEIFNLPDPRDDRALRIERRHLWHFSPSAPTILLILHHEYLLLNRQVCREGLEILFKNHTLFFSCGPYILKQLLARIGEAGGPPKHWLKWIKKIELDWVTFPNLRLYPPERSEGRDEWWWEQEYCMDDYETDLVDHIRGAQYNAHYDEHDYEGGNGYYDDNFYGAEEPSLYPSWPQHHHTSQPDNPNDPFGLSTHYPFRDPTLPPHESCPSSTDAKFSLLISTEVSPLFTYLADSSIFSSLSTFILPLYFLSKSSLRARHTTPRSARNLPLKLRYWVHVLAHALRLLLLTHTPLVEVRVRYMPWDIWASMDPSDSLPRVVEKGVWFGPEEEEEEEDEDGTTNLGAGGREGECEAFKMLWRVLRGAEVGGSGAGGEVDISRLERLGKGAEVRLVMWDGDLNGRRVGDELEVVFTKEII